MMNHPDTGTLRRMHDEPDAIDAQTREHVASCEACAQAAKHLAQDARFAQDALAGGVRVDVQRALARVHDRKNRRDAARAPQWRRAAGLAAAAAFAGALFLTPLGGYAGSFLTIFEPQHFQPVAVTAAQLRELHLLPGVDRIGTQHLIAAGHDVQYASLAQAQRHLTFAAALPASMPAGLPRAARYFVHTSSDWTFTFSAAKARAFAARSHRTLPAMPAGLDGTTIHVHTSDFFEARYGAHRGAFVEVVETRAPTVTSTGASLSELEAYLLKMPGVPSQLAAQLRALGDIQNTLPVPVIAGRQRAQRVTVHGVSGLAVGDNTGVGAGVMWQDAGVIHLVAGPISVGEALSVANGVR